MRIDLNSDVGESLGPWPMGADEALMPFVTSVNVACGFHAGDPVVMARTVDLAVRSAVAVGAHPGYPDLAGFGRRDMEMAGHEIEAAVLYQVAALAGFCRAAGTELRHVKPHGALYNRAARDDQVAGAVARGVRAFSDRVVLVGLAGSRLLDAARDRGLPVASEAFADRVYEADGSLRSRSLPGALLGDPSAAAAQALAICREGRVTASDGATVELYADTICIHSDTPGAPGIARAVREALEGAGVRVAALGA